MGKDLVRPHSISVNKPGMVAHDCDPSYVGGIGKKIAV
jgi:hypothetical protein